MNKLKFPWNGPWLDESGAKEGGASFLGKSSLTEIIRVTVMMILMMVVMIMIIFDDDGGDDYDHV